MKIHITLLGQETLPLFYPIQTFPIDRVFIICTSQNQSIAQLVKDILSESVYCEVSNYVDAFDIKSVIDECERIHTIYPNDDFLYNLTGGTKIMAIGAYLVALRHRADAIYTDSKKCVNLNDFTSSDLKSHVDTETIIKLQGQKLNSYLLYKRDKSLSDCSKKIMNFINSNYPVYKKLSDLYKTNATIKIPEYDNNGNNNAIKYTEHGDRIIIEKKGTIIFDEEHPELKKLLFEGRWWEVLIADTVDKWSNGRYVIWRNVCFDPRFQPKNKNLSKNEVDVLVNVGNTLIFIECKSGMVTQENIYTMAGVKNTYGSAKAKSVLISYHNIPDAILEKASDAQIDVIKPKKGMTLNLDDIPSRLGSIIKSLKL